MLSHHVSSFSCVHTPSPESCLRGCVSEPLLVTQGRCTAIWKPLFPLDVFFFQFGCYGYSSSESSPTIIFMDTCFISPGQTPRSRIAGLLVRCLVLFLERQTVTQGGELSGLIRNLCVSVAPLCYQQGFCLCGFRHSGWYAVGSDGGFKSHSQGFTVGVAPFSQQRSLGIR